MGIKIMMSPEVVNSVAGALITKQVFREIARRSVRTPLDEHCFAAFAHQGLSRRLQPLGLGDIAKLLSCSPGRVQDLLAEHALHARARGACRVCRGASKELRGLLLKEKKTNRGIEEPLSVFALLQASQRGAR